MRDGSTALENHRGNRMAHKRFMCQINVMLDTSFHQVIKQVDSLFIVFLHNCTILVLSENPLQNIV